MNYFVSLLKPHNESVSAERARVHGLRRLCTEEVIKPNKAFLSPSLSLSFFFLLWVRVAPPSVPTSARGDVTGRVIAAREDGWTDGEMEGGRDEWGRDEWGRV